MVHMEKSVQKHAHTIKYKTRAVPVSFLHQFVCPDNSGTTEPSWRRSDKPDEAARLFSQDSVVPRSKLETSRT